MAQYQGGGSLISKIGSYLQIVSKDPRSTAFVPLAEAYRQIGLLDDALEAARLGTGALPHFSPGFSTLGRVLGQMGRIDEAMSAFAKALSIDRQSQAALVGLARLHLIRGERDQARKILQEAAGFHPNDQHVRDMLVALDLPRPWDRLKGDQPVAAVAADTSRDEQAAGGQPAPVADAAEAILTATLAEIYVKQGLTDKAVDVYREILRREPDNAAAIKRINELTAASDDAATTTAEPPTSPVAVTSADVSSEEPVMENSAAVPEPSLPRSPLQILESWLAGIRQRRDHVH